MPDEPRRTWTEFLSLLWLETPWPFKPRTREAINRAVLAYALVGSVIYCAVKQIENDLVTGGLLSLASATVTFYFLKGDE